MVNNLNKNKVNKMKKVLSLVTVAMLGLGGVISGNAGEINISSGPADKSFIKMGNNLVSAVGTPTTKNIQSNGSIENIENLILGKANVGFVFADTYKLKLSQDPRAEKLKVLGVLNKGCLYTVVRDGGKIDDDGDLETAGVKVDPGLKGAGATTTWEYLGNFDKDFKKPEILNIGGGDPASLNALLFGTVDAVLSMQTPSTENTLVKDVLADKNLKFLPITDGDFTDKLADGRPIYTKEKITISKGKWSDEKLETICTDVLVLANDTLAADDFRLLSAILYRNKAAIIGTK